MALAWRQSESGWLGVWSISTSKESDDPLAAARKRCEAALGRGFHGLAREHDRWWEEYWSRASVAVPNPVVERQWYLETYKFGSATRPDTPPITLQGPWTADDMKIPPWKGDYHHDLEYATELLARYSGNRLEGASGFVRWLWETKGNARRWTARFFGLPGLNVPMTADLEQNQIGGWHQYTHSATTAAWLAHHFWLHWRYSMDRQFLEERAYPWLQQVATFLEAVTEKGPDGKRTLPLSSSPEIHDNRLQAWFPSITNYDLALIRWTFEKTAGLAEQLEEPAEANRWRGILSEMPELAVAPDDLKLLVAKDDPLPGSHRHFSHLMAIHPLGTICWENGERDRAIIKASLADLDARGTSQWCGYSFAWLANLAARARDGEKAERALEVFSRPSVCRNGFHANGDQSGQGYSNFRYPALHAGRAISPPRPGLQEMLLQSCRHDLRLFPAILARWRGVVPGIAGGRGICRLRHAQRRPDRVSPDRFGGRGRPARRESVRRGWIFAAGATESVQAEGQDLLLKTRAGQTVTFSRK